ncbi:enhancer of filamentation 1 isoform X1 [Ornithorhynchus anatinus]|uniref:Enhancer of filamentation 1 n=1 Tax=Ornithorhynchus anatinus TaxID=9258 RepID=F6X0A9_ORNAN|nr:enhancer of filamentation 1 isoform X1 [Ornithorhynchus anatinus]
MKYKNLMARALYDNVPECAEELAFRKGDILTVIEQNTGGLEGWWLCSLHGRQGIVPGNRVKLLIGPVPENPPNHDQPSSRLVHPAFGQQKLYQGPNSQTNLQDAVYQVPPSSYQTQGIYQVPTGHGVQEQDVYQVPPSAQRSVGALNGSSLSKKVITPVRTGYGYEFPSKYQTDTYDIPPSHPHQGVYDIPPTALKSLGFSVSVEEAKPHGVYDIPPAKGIYAIPPSAFRDDTGLQEKEYDFPPPTRHHLRPEARPEGVYDIPPPSTKAAGKDPPTKYSCDVVGPGDLTPRRTQGLYDIPPSHQSPQAGQPVVPQNDAYDIPRGAQFLEPQKGTHNRAAPEERNGVYDVPPQAPQDTKGSQDVTDGINRLSFSSTGSTRSNMSTSSTTSKESLVSASPSQDKKLLLLDPDTAIERLYRLQQVSETVVSNLMALVTADWRSYGYMERHINEIRSAVEKVERSLKDYLCFAKGAVMNASCLSELTLHQRMKRELQRLEDSHQILAHTSQELNGCSWSLNVLAVNKAQGKCDNLDRFVMVARTVPDDAKQLTASISANAEVLFRPGSGLRLKNGTESIMSAADYPHNGPQTQTPHPGEGKGPTSFRPLPPGLGRDHRPDCNGSDCSERSWMDDYDYVHLQGKEEFERQQRELLEKENIVKQNKMQLEHHQLNQFQLLEQEITKPVENDISKWKPSQNLPATNSIVSSQDRQLLYFYFDQCETHYISLLNAIDALFNCVSTAQPPRIFVTHSKFVILSAHKLVFIGDTLTRQVAAQEIRNKVMNSSNQLCDQLKNIVRATKMAALHYPNTGALQEMVHRVTDLSRNARLFKQSLIELATL